MKEAIEALKAGDRERGFQLLRRHLAVNPRDATAWLWMSEAVTKPEQKIDALQRVLRLHPNHPRADLIRQRLRKLNALTRPQPVIGAETERVREEQEELPPSFQQETVDRSSPTQQVEPAEETPPGRQDDDSAQEPARGKRINLDELREQYSHTAGGGMDGEGIGRPADVQPQPTSPTPSSPSPEPPPPEPTEPESVVPPHHAGLEEAPVADEGIESVEPATEPVEEEAPALEPAEMPAAPAEPVEGGESPVETPATLSAEQQEEQKQDDVPRWIWIIMFLSLFIVIGFFWLLLVMSNII